MKCPQKDTETTGSSPNQEFYFVHAGRLLLINNLWKAEIIVKLKIANVVPTIFEAHNESLQRSVRRKTQKQQAAAPTKILTLFMKDAGSSSIICGRQTLL